MRLVAVVVASGCGTTITATLVNRPPGPMQPRPAEAVEIFTSGPPPRPHVDVAYLEAEQESDMSLDRTPAFFGKLRERAGRMGCDALVIGSPTNNPGFSLDFKHQTTVRGMTATCIVYTAPEDTAAPDETARQTAEPPAPEPAVRAERTPVAAAPVAAAPVATAATVPVATAPVATAATVPVATAPVATAPVAPAP